MDQLAGNWSNLNYPQRRTGGRCLSDIQDGAGFKTLQQKAQLQTNNPESLGFVLFTDGIPLWKSSNMSLWPAYLSVANLPPHLRMRQENVLLASVWVGEGKPNMKQFLKPVVEILKKLQIEGLTLIDTPCGVKTIRGTLLCSVLDLVAKAPTLSMKQFNGYYGCPTCLHPGSHNGRSMVYLPRSYALRTATSVKRDAEEAERSGSAVHGILGKSVLQPCLNIVDGVPVDYMHCVLEGVTKWLLHSWVTSSNHDKPFYLGRVLKNVDSLLLQQRPPHNFARPPRSIMKHLKHWKASEHRSWLLYYALPVLSNFLPSLYLHHLSLLVTAIHVLLKQDILEAQVFAAEAMINTFYKLLPELYGVWLLEKNAVYEKSLGQ